MHKVYQKLLVIKNRVYRDYLMPSRLEEYEKIIVTLLERGYLPLTLRAYVEKLNGSDLDNEKYFLSRHDIDTDIDTAKAFFEVEKRHNFYATYYFRQSTLDISFMKELESFGSEASYHFEEVADYCKREHIKSTSLAFEKMFEIKQLFRKNFLDLEHNVGVKFKTVCSHGDFANRRLGIINNEITKDARLKEELGIICETYDVHVMDSFDAYLSDGKFPLTYKSEDILALCEGKNRVCMLSHPRQWRSNAWVNTKENIKRIYEEVRW